MIGLDALVFDVDGVLFDSERVSQQSWLSVSREMGCPQVGENYLHFVGRSHADIQAEMLRLYGPDFPQEELLARCSRRSRAYMDEYGIPLKPGVRELLDFLRQQGVLFGLASSTYYDRTVFRLDQTGLLPYFSVIVTGDMVSHSKPDPEIYLLACEKLGVEPGRAAAIEDSRNGIRSAHRAGMRTIMVPDLIPPDQSLAPLIWKTFDSLVQVRDFLAQEHCVLPLTEKKQSPV